MSLQEEEIWAHRETPGMHTERRLLKDTVRKKVAAYKPGRGPGESNPADTLTLDS
jgi:hypothetical protein